MAKRKKYEFKPDRRQVTFFKKLYITRLQRLQLAKWGLLAGLCLLLVVIQNVIMSRIRFSGAVIDLPVCIILLIGLYEGTENGSLFALIASAVYLFSGTAPGPYAVGLLTALTILVGLFRQINWHRSFGSIALCTCVSIVVYEMATFLIGVFLENTIWSRFGVFLLTAGLTCITVLPFYPLVRVISKIGGDTWKE